MHMRQSLYMLISGITRLRINFTFSETRRIVLPEAETTRSYLHSSGHNTRTWRNDGQTDGRQPL